MSSLIRVKPQSLMKVGAFLSTHHSKERYSMLNQWNATICSTLIFFAMARAADGDTTKTYHTDDVVVTATRSVIQLKDSPSPVQILTIQDVLRTNGSSVSDILKSSESIFVKDQGPTASLKTVSFRGMAAEHILVLLNGTRLNNFQNGQVDFSLLPMQNIERIEIVRGGNSALYGADALGGVINILSKQPDDALRVHAGGSVGSFQYRRCALELQGRPYGIGIVAGYMQDRAGGDYPYVSHEMGFPDKAETRLSADFKRAQFYLTSDMKIDDRSDVILSLQHIHSNQGVPGPLPSLYPARQDDDVYTTVASIHDTHMKYLVFSLNLGFNYDLQNFYSQTKTTTATLNPQIQLIVNSWDRMIGGGEFIEGHLEGFLPDAMVTRIQRSLYLSNEMLFQWESATFDRLSLYQTIRYDVLSEGEDAYSPKIGVNFRIIRNWDTRIRASYGKNFRMPTFNDLYYPFGYGNPSLKPERSESYDIGAETCFDRDGMHRLQLTYFHIDMRNRILLNDAFYPLNVHQALSSGIESRYDAKFFDDAVNLFFDVTLNNAIRRNGSSIPDVTEGKRLLNIPQSVVSLGFSVHLKKLSLHMTQIYASRRFTEEDESQWLPGYSTTDMNISYLLQLGMMQLSLRGELSNLFDADYQVLRNYPMPGRSYKVGMSVEY
jgi:outer membrane cobalamin receptor